MINFKVNKDDLELIDKIVERAWTETTLGLNYDKLSLHMDISACHAKGCPLRLTELLEADDFNFAHDVFGIVGHLNRLTGKLEDCFLPRFGLKEQS